MFWSFYILSTGFFHLCLEQQIPDKVVHRRNVSLLFKNDFIIDITTCKCRSYIQYMYNIVWCYVQSTPSAFDIFLSCFCNEVFWQFINNHDMLWRLGCQIKLYIKRQQYTTQNKLSIVSCTSHICTHTYGDGLLEVGYHCSWWRRAPEIYEARRLHAKLKLADNSRIRFSRLIFFSFIRRFWNQILTCLSVRWTLRLISRRRSRVKYMLKRNSFSSSRVWCLV